jgi:tetratricopeptide (TPR) repeat protein
VARTTRTCSAALAALLATVSAAPAGARPTVVRSGAQTFVEARAAADAGDARRAAMLYAALAAAEPGNPILSRRALSQAVLAGDMPLALRLAAREPAAGLPVDARLLLLAEKLRTGSGGADPLAGWPAELGFLKPFVTAWILAGDGRTDAALQALRAVGQDNMLSPAREEQEALILLSAGRLAEARPLVAAVLDKAGNRSRSLRLAFAAALVRKGARSEALALLLGRDPVLARAARLVGSGTPPEQPLDSPAAGLGELLRIIAVALGREEGEALPLALLQVAHHADPRHAQGRILLAAALGRSGRVDEALALLRLLPAESALLPEARDAEIRLLAEARRLDEALARARAMAGGRAGAEDWARLGDVLDEMNRHGEAAEAYGRAAALADAGEAGPERWTLHLLRGASLEQAERWAEAEKALETAYALAPDNPVVLNYLGYARLERGEQLDEAEALIARASSLAPNDASITDSLGWAQFKRGRVDQAIATLSRAAAADPSQAEIHEHLGDALYTAGRRFEARFAWNAALATAEEEVRPRIEAKIAGGLSPAHAAP